MDFNLKSRIVHGWNAFMNPDESYNHGLAYSRRPDRPMLTTGNERSIVSSIITRIGIDASSYAIRHVRVDQNGAYQETIDSGLNACFGVEANIDQSGRAFVQDIVMSMCDEGVVAIVPTDTNINPKLGSYDIITMRTGKIIHWMPQHVRVSVYNENRGERQEITVEKRRVAILENPLYAVMNEQNSTLKRLIAKLNLLDAIDNQSGSGKLDLLLSFPYSIKTPARMEQAEKRRQQIEQQLAGSKYGIAYVDGTEKITQLNRPAENNLMAQIEYLTSMLYGQLGITDEVLNGTADEDTMNNYYNRTIEPILSAVTCEAGRKFITKTARTQGQTIKHFRDIFAHATLTAIADASDKLTRNEILTSNEVRSFVGVKPSKEKEADQLRNKNLNPAPATAGIPQKPAGKVEEGNKVNEN